MAKGLRSTVKKRNRAKLRTTVFGPAHDARTERLSAKLQELASQPRPNDSGHGAMELEATKQVSTKDSEQVEAVPSPDLPLNILSPDVDFESGPKSAKLKSKASSRNKGSNGVRKYSRRKEKNLSVFPKYRLKRYQKSSTEQTKSR